VAYTVYHQGYKKCSLCGHSQSYLAHQKWGAGVEKWGWAQHKQLATPQPPVRKAWPAIGQQARMDDLFKL